MKNKINIYKEDAIKYPKLSSGFFLMEKYIGNKSNKYPT